MFLVSNGRLEGLDLDLNFRKWFEL